MKRNLLKQMRAEWRANIWMAVEMLIVSVVLFVLADNIYITTATVNEPLGFNSEHCYLIEISTVTEASPDYVEYSDKENRNKDLLTFLDRIRTRPEIEAASLSHNAYPYNPNNSYKQIDIDTFSMAMAPLLNRVVQPEFFSVFKIEGANGETPEQLGKALERDKILVSDNALDERAGLKSLKSLYGCQLVKDGSDTLELHTSFKTMRYTDFETQYANSAKSMFEYLTPEMYSLANECCVRVRANMDKNFIEKLMSDAESDLRVGNWYIRSVKSFDDIKKNYNRHWEASMRNTIVCAFFLLLNIFLGILGTFWYRTQQRMKEISLRMVSGATRGDIFRRILGEGQLLLLFVTPAAIAIDYMLTHYELTSWYNGYFEPVRFCACAIIACTLIAIMIAIGIYFPARKAMTISPATALKTE